MVAWATCCVDDVRDGILINEDLGFVGSIIVSLPSCCTDVGRVTASCVGEAAEGGPKEVLVCSEARTIFAGIMCHMLVDIVPVVGGVAALPLMWGDSRPVEASL